MSDQADSFLVLIKFQWDDAALAQVATEKKMKKDNVWLSE